MHNPLEGGKLETLWKQEDGQKKFCLEEVKLLAVHIEELTGPFELW